MSSAKRIHPFTLFTLGSLAKDICVCVLVKTCISKHYGKLL